MPKSRENSPEQKVRACKKGQRKIEKKKIDENQRKRLSETFRHRKVGLLKKAHELSELCANGLELMFTDNHGHIHYFTNMNKRTSNYFSRELIQEKISSNNFYLYTPEMYKIFEKLTNNKTYSELVSKFKVLEWLKFSAKNLSLLRTLTSFMQYKKKIAPSKCSRDSGPNNWNHTGPGRDLDGLAKKFPVNYGELIREGLAAPLCRNVNMGQFTPELQEGQFYNNLNLG
jgi:hypothetical protein